MKNEFIWVTKGDENDLQSKVETGWSIKKAYSMLDMMMIHLTYPEEGDKPEIGDTVAERQLAGAVDVKQVKPEEANHYISRGYEYTNKWKGLVELTLYEGKEIQVIEIGEGEHEYYVDMNTFGVMANSLPQANNKAYEYIKSKFYEPEIDTIGLVEECGMEHVEGTICRICGFHKIKPVVYEKEPEVKIELKVDGVLTKEETPEEKELREVSEALREQAM